METLNISTLAKHFSDESAAYTLLESMRWPDGPECPHCGSVDHAYYLTPRDGHRRTSTGKVSYRRLWKCAECRKKFSVLVGTIFERSQVPLSKWLLALYMMAANKNGVAAYEAHRTLGVTNKTAWFMMHRIREGMKRGDASGLLSGVIVADETFIGGAEKAKHASKRKGRGDGHGDKTVVLTLIETHTGEARSRVIPDVTGDTLAKAMAGQVEASRSILHTDENPAYAQLGETFLAHGRVNHSKGEYVAGNVTTNHAEGFFGQLKRSIDGTHHHVSTKHLPRYPCRIRLPIQHPEDERLRADDSAGRADGRAPIGLPGHGESVGTAKRVNTQFATTC